MQLKHAQRTKVEKEPDLNPAKKDMKVGGQELYSATTYSEKLKPSCVDERRKEEMSE